MMTSLITCRRCNRTTLRTFDRGLCSTCMYAEAGERIRVGLVDLSRFLRPAFPEPKAAPPRALTPQERRARFYVIRGDLR